MNNSNESYDNNFKSPVYGDIEFFNYPPLNESDRNNAKEVIEKSMREFEQSIESLHKQVEKESLEFDSKLENSQNNRDLE